MFVTDQSLQINLIERVKTYIKPVNEKDIKKEESENKGG
jgi:hypothetical protein